MPSCSSRCLPARWRRRFFLYRAAPLPPPLHDGGVEFAAEHEDRREEIQEHQRDDHRREAGIHRHVVAGEAREIEAEADARHQRGDHREHDARQNLREAAPSRRQPRVQDEQRDDHRGNGDAVARQRQHPLVGFDQQRNVAARGFEDQRAEHDQERQQERGGGGDQRVADRLQTQPVPASLFGDGIGAVERDAQALDTVRREVERERRADGQRVAARGGQHVMNFAGERVRHFQRQDLQHQLRGLIGQILRAEETCERGQHDEERKQRHQRRQRDMAGDGPAVVGEECIEGVQSDRVEAAK